MQLCSKLKQLNQKGKSMKSLINKQKFIAAIVVALLLASLTTAVIYHQSNKALKSELKEEKLKSETLLSEKLALAKEIEKLKTEGL